MKVVRSALSVGRRALELLGMILSGIASTIVVGFGVGILWVIIFGPSQEEREWSGIRQESEKGELAAYRIKSFLERWPSSQKAGEAVGILDELEWKEASAQPPRPDCESRTVLSPNRAYWEYIDKRPVGPHADRARELLDKACWEHAGATHAKNERPVSYLTYLRLFPGGNFASSAELEVRSGLLGAGEAYRDRTLFEELRDRSSDSSYYFGRAQAALADIDAWQSAAEADSYNGYREYLTTFPNGLFKNDAIAWMEYHGRWKSRTAADKVDEAVRQSAGDLAVTAALPFASNLSSVDATLVETCKNDEEFADLQYGASIVGGHYDALRRRAVFGFLAPDEERARAGAIAMLRLLSSEQVIAIAQSAWRSVNFSVDQRRALKTLARVALEHEHVFNKGYDKTAEDILAARWDWFNFGVGWYDIQSFSKPARPCLGLPFILSRGSLNDESQLFAVGSDITTTFYDFWYRSRQDGTTRAFKDILSAVVSAE